MFKYIDDLGRKRTPFFFAINFLKTEIIAIPLDKCPKNIRFKCDNFSVNTSCQDHMLTINKIKQIKIINAVSLKNYTNAFNRVQEEMRAGNTYLLNLTYPTQIKIDESLESLYEKSSAKFKCYYQDKFLAFSPERFIKIENNKVSAYPMKGTSQLKDDPSGDNLMQSRKESAEHLMIVDLLRNDLNRVSKHIKVRNFRYKEKVFTGSDWIWQTSSEIEGTINNWEDNIGTILNQLLPAGSVSGTPKPRTVSIIRDVESDDRGFYTGVFGYFDGQKLDSGVLIRFIEKREDGQYFYRSGGGITIQSNVDQEYQELLGKVYLPVVKDLPVSASGGYTPPW